MAVPFKQTMANQRTAAVIKMLTNLRKVERWVAVLDGSFLCKRQMLAGYIFADVFSLFDWE